MVASGFNRTEYLRLMDTSSPRVGYGEVEWSSNDTKHTGTFELNIDPGMTLPLEFLICVNELRSDEPTFPLKLNGMHAARIDVNGMHRFEGERVARRSTHFQCHEYGASGSLATREIPVPPFPALSKGVNVSYEAELKRCFRESVAWLNVDVSGVVWSPLPFEGGK